MGSSSRLSRLRPLAARLLRGVWRMLVPGVLVAALVLGAGWWAAWQVPLPPRIEASSSPVVRYADGTTAHVFLAGDERWRIDVGLHEVDDDYLVALKRFEDERFDSHLGVDLVAVGRAALTNVSSGRVVSGASTLTMQLARLAEPRPRTLRSKAIEAARAVQIELRMSKADILRAYLQLAPYGRNIEGIEAGSLAYFGHSASSLSPAEIATLLAVPQNPSPRTPSKANEPLLREARDRVAQRLLEQGALPRSRGGLALEPALVLQEIQETAVPTRLLAQPREAPHAATWLRASDRAAADAGGRFDTTLDRGIQRLVDERLHRERKSLERRGIHNGAVVVVEHRTMEVRALGGNLAFWDGEDGEQIPAFAVPRSPGSALKPFVYAAAIDRGVALPSSMQRDVPITWGAYSPRNYDGNFDGLVRLDDALSRSLNVPFVDLLADVGIERFLGLLRRAGVDNLQPEPGFYGLSVAVGGVELTALELAGLYGTLARGGAHRPLTWLRSGGYREGDGDREGDRDGDRDGDGDGDEDGDGDGDRDGDEHAAPEDQIFSPGSSWLTRQALARRDRPDFPTRRSLSGAPQAIHWKTGTSTGRRDAWAIGSGPRYTVAVWLGNLDSKGSSHLVGADAAGPILFDLLEGLSPRGRATNDPIPADLSRVRVCAFSGHPVGDACPSSRDEWARPEAVPTERCAFHVRMEVDRDTGLAVAPRCREGKHTTARTFLVWPAGIRTWLRDRHRQLPEAPRFAEGCEPPISAEPPTIVHPPQGHVAFLLPGLDADRQQLPLQADGPGLGELSWFVNGAFLGRAAADERVWWTPEPGEHDVVVSDASGHSSRRRLEVRWRP